jgi:hypothetical protein
MKIIKMRTQKSSRWAAILLATVVAVITSVVVANATQTITTPNAAKITYNLAAGANSAVITPATNTSLLVIGCCTTPDYASAGQVTLVHIPPVAGAPTGFMRWTGLESYALATPSTIVSGGSSAAGTHLVYIDFHHLVDIQTASGGSVLIHNADTATRAGNVTLIW